MLISVQMKPDLCLAFVGCRVVDTGIALKEENGEAVCMEE